MKYDSVFFNKERYYDTTAGAALLNIIREERKQNYVVPVKKPDEQELFSKMFSQYYEKTHIPRANGKPLKYTNPGRIKKYIKLYEYCMMHCDDDDFNLDDVALRFGLGSTKKVEQCFSKRGDISKIIDCWNSYKALGVFRWPRKEI